MTRETAVIIAQWLVAQRQDRAAILVDWPGWLPGRQRWPAGSLPIRILNERYRPPVTLLHPEADDV